MRLVNRWLLSSHIRYLLSTIVSVWLIGCAGSYHYSNNVFHYQRSIYIPVCIDKEFSFADRKAIKNSLSEWNYALNGFFFLQESPCSGQERISQDAIVFVKAHRQDPMILAAHQEGTIAVTYPWGSGPPYAIIYVASDDIHSNLSIVVDHELGHAFGAEHQDHTLMQLGGNPIPCIDQNTMQQVATHMHLDFKLLNICITN